MRKNFLKVLDEVLNVRYDIDNPLRRGLREALTRRKSARLTHLLSQVF